MTAAVEGTWSFAILPDGASTPITVTVHVAQAAAAPAAAALAPTRSFIRAAHACGNRTLVKSAGACLDSSTMPLAVTFLSGNPLFANAAMSGTFEIYTTAFATAETNLEFVLGGYLIVSQLTPEGMPVMPRVGPGQSLGSLAVITHG